MIYEPGFFSRYELMSHEGLRRIAISAAPGGKNGKSNQGSPDLSMKPPPETAGMGWFGVFDHRILESTYVFLSYRNFLGN